MNWLKPLSCLLWLALAVSAGCVNPASEDGRACPCGSGWMCCEATGTCVREGASCALSDTVPPAAPVVKTPSPEVPSAYATVTLEGLAEPGASVDLFASSDCAGTPLASAPADVAGAFRVSLTLPLNTTTHFHARARDAAGNASPCASGPRLTHDDSPPAPPTLTGPAAYTALATPEATGTTEPGAHVWLFAAMNCLGEPVAEGTARTDGAFSLSIRAEPNTLNRLTARVADAAGNVSGCSAARLFTHDDVAPASPSALWLETPSPSTTTAPTLFGHAEPGLTVRAHVGSTTCGADPLHIFTTTVGTDGRFIFQAQVPPNTQTQLSVDVVDAAGNRSACAWNLSFVHDGRPPAPPVLLGASQPSDTTVDAPFSVYGYAENGSTLHLYASANCTGREVGYITVNGPKNSFGLSDFTVPDVTAPPEATTVFSAFAMDPLSNTSECSSTRVVHTHSRARGWGTSEVPGQVGGTGLTMSHSGQTLAVWETYASTWGPSTVLASFHTADGGWSTPETLATTSSGTNNLSFAVADSGHSVVVWADMVKLRWEVHVRRFVPGRGWQPLEFLRATPTAHASAPKVAMDAAGNTFVAWLENGQHQVSRYTEAQGWETPVGFPYVGSTLDTRHLVASGNGDAWLFWAEQPDLDVPAVIWGSHYTPATGWSPRERHLEQLTPGLGLFDLAADGLGGAVMVWEAYAAGTFTSKVWARHFAPEKGWGEPRALTTQAFAGMPSVTLNMRGDAAAVWTGSSSQSSLKDEVWAVTFSATTGWSAPVRLNSSRGYIGALGPFAAVDGTGAVLVGWTQTFGAMATESSSSTPPNQNVLVARYEPGVGWEPEQPIADGTSYSYGFSLGMDEQGNALALWSRTPVKDASPVIGSRWFR